MNGYDVYRMYLGLKMHFKSANYDYIKYHGAVRSSKESFDKRNDRYYFQKLSNKFSQDDLKLYFISNFLFKDDIWIGNLFDEECQSRFYETKGRHERITYLFKKDVEFLMSNVENFKDLFNSVDGQHPPLLKHTLSQEISIETLIIFNEFFGCFDKWDSQIADPVVWPEVKKKCLKYRSFLDRILLKKKTFSKIISETAKSHNLL